MYINDVIRKARSYFPSEYDLTELYCWCDEVSAMLSVIDRPTYRERVFSVSDDGTILLPDGVTIENIEKIIVSGRELRKSDMRTFGNKTVNIKGALPRSEDVPPARSAYATIVYQAPYRAIRLSRYNGEASVDKDAGVIYINTNDFHTGDTLILQINGQTISDIPLLGIEYNTDLGKYELHSVPEALSEVDETESESATITRVVTEKTVCDSPFDSMYIDYILAKIGMYQRDYTAYNQYMQSFNSRLAAYKKWIAERLPKGHSELINWW
jgi:hypothetical protein